MLQSIILGLEDSVSPCALSLLLFLTGFLFLTAIRENILKNSVSFIGALFLILFAFYERLLTLVSLFKGGNWIFSLPVLGLIGSILVFVLGIYGIVHFFYEESRRETLSRIDRYVLSLPAAVLFAVLLSVHFICCSAITVTIVIVRGAYLSSLLLYLFAFILPLIAVSSMAYVLSAKNEEPEKTRLLRLVGGVILILCFCLLTPFNFFIFTAL